ncbi:MAG: hypothetical protein VB858_22820, partial [Planctomycetaceae bacterium]
MARQSALPPEITRQLIGLRRRLRFLASVRGAGLAVAGISLLLLSLLILDWCLDFPAPVRAGLSFILGAGTLGLVGWFIARPLLRAIPDAEVASLAEQQAPALNERLTSLVLLADTELAQPQHSSPLMREMLERETVQQLRGADLERYFPTRPAIRRFGLGVAAACFLLFLFILFPAVSSGLLARLFQPWQHFASVGPLQFEVQDVHQVAARGSDISIAAKVSWRSGSEAPVPEPVTVHRVTADGETSQRKSGFNPDTQTFDARLADI